MKKILLTIISGILAASGTFAQDAEYNYEPYPYGFISLQGGAQATFTNVPFTDLITPIGAVSVGGFFPKGVGFRVNVQGWKNKSGYSLPQSDLTYKFNYVNADLDIMLNLSTMFSQNQYRKFNVILFGGFGFAASWDDTDHKNVIAANNLGYIPAWIGDNCLSHSFHAGLQLEYKVAKNWGINLEVGGTNFDDNFNAKLNSSTDWQVTALAGVTYKFGFRKKHVSKPAPSYPTETYQSPAPATPAPTPETKKEEPAPVTAPAKKEKKNIEVFFTINSATIRSTEESKVAELAQWLKEHPNAKASLTAYADAGTGTADVNMKVSQKRVNSVANMLTNKYGIDRSRIKMDYKGDTVQPYSENDKNRVTIGIAEEQ